MSQPFQIKPATGEGNAQPQQPGTRNDRCSLKPLTALARELAGSPGSQLDFMLSDFGYCTRGACEQCPLSKCSESSPTRIESGDTVLTRMGRLFHFVGFGENSRGLRTGFVHLRSRDGERVRLQLDEITLYSKAAAA
jgi:hypothetical protein